MPLALAVEIAPEASVTESQVSDSQSVRMHLREQTRPAHERAEAAVMRALNRCSKDSYVRYLERVFGLYSPLEAKLLAVPAYTERVTDFAQRRKVPWLLDDLRHFGRGVRSLPLCTTLPDLTHTHAVLGTAYVFEGATLGGPVLLGALAFEPAPAPARGGTFLSGYGPSTAERWRGFTRVLDQAVTNTSELTRLVHGARQAFAVFEDWIAAS